MVNSVMIVYPPSIWSRLKLAIRKYQARHEGHYSRGVIVDKYGNKHGSVETWWWKVKR